jgi:hypothetical protein
VGEERGRRGGVEVEREERGRREGGGEREERRKVP